MTKENKTKENITKKNKESKIKQKNKNVTGLIYLHLDFWFLSNLKEYNRIVDSLWIHELMNYEPNGVPFGS